MHILLVFREHPKERDQGCKPVGMIGRFGNFHSNARTIHPKVGMKRRVPAVGGLGPPPGFSADAPRRPIRGLGTWTGGTRLFILSYGCIALVLG